MSCVVPRCPFPSLLSPDTLPPPRGSSMAGRSPGAGGRFPNRHGVGGFATKFAHSLSLLSPARRRRPSTMHPRMHRCAHRASGCHGHHATSRDIGVVRRRLIILVCLGDRQRRRGAMVCAIHDSATRADDQETCSPSEEAKGEHHQSDSARHRVLGANRATARQRFSQHATL